MELTAGVGRIIEEQKNYYVADTEQGFIRLTVRGALKKDNVRVAVGDVVDIEVTSTDPLEGLITKIHERSSLLKRPAIANLSQILFVNTFRDPAIDLTAIDRFLFSAEVYRLRAIIVFNKDDLVAESDEEEFNEVRSIYESIGYATLRTSATSGKGVPELLAICKDELSAFAGLSGVGKSSLLSTIFPDRDFRIGDLSAKTKRGTHTTTSIVLLKLENGGYIADTPGLSFIDIPTVDETEVINYFPELTARIGKCRFRDCIHEDQPGCAVQDAIDAGEIASWRRDQYLNIYYEMRTRRQKSYKR